MSNVVARLRSGTASRVGLKTSALSWGVDALAAVAFVLVFWSPSLAPTLTSSERLEWGGLVALLSASVILRWKLPVVSPIVAVVVTIVGWVTGLNSDPLLAAAWCLYPFALRRASRSHGTGLVAVAVVMAAASMMAPPFGDPQLGQRSVIGICALGASWLLGHVEARRQVAVAASVRDQERYERTRQQVVMAREVHDVVGHALSFISAEADTARTLPGMSEDELRESLEHIEKRSRAALEEVQALVRGLRSGELVDGGSSASTLQDLVATARASGLTVTASLDLPELAPEVQAVVNRVVQESLSNVVRHSEADSCEVAIWQEEGDVAVRVDDNGKGLRSGSATGSGLTGMRERVEEIGGSLTVSTRLEGGTRVLARLPLGLSRESGVRHE